MGLKDKVAQIKIHARIDRASLGNFGDWKEVKGTKRLYEMREHYGPGYRIFYTIVNNKQVLLLAGSTKKDQSRVVQTAIEYLADYESAGGHD